MKLKKIICIFTLMAMLFPVLLSGADDKADQVINDYIELIGGQKALEKINTLEYDYSMQHILEGKVRNKVIYKKRPNFMRRGTKDSKGIGITRSFDHYFQGFNPKTKKVIWRKLSNVDMPNTYILGVFGPFMDYKKRGYSISYQKEIIEDGKKIHKLKMTFGKNQSQSLYFDDSSKKYIGFESAINPRTNVSGYSKNGVYLIPTQSEFKGKSRGRMVHHINIKKNIKINTEIDSKLFDIPEGVK